MIVGEGTLLGVWCISKHGENKARRNVKGGGKGRGVGGYGGVTRAQGPHSSLAQKKKKKTRARSKQMK